MRGLRAHAGNKMKAT